jgi:hypothetical protein
MAEVTATRFVDEQPAVVERALDPASILEAEGTFDVVDVETIEDGGGSNPFDGARIEVSESSARKAAFPAVWLGRVKTRLDEVATRVTYGEPGGRREH